MYVIFPADEVVYLSYGRLIVVPANASQETSNTPIRTNTLPLEETSCNLSPNTNPLPSKRNIHNEPFPGSSSKIENDLVESQPSSSRGSHQNVQTISLQGSKPKRKSLKLNFSLLKRSTSKNSEPQSSLSSRVRYSVGHREQAGIITPPSEAFKRFCNIGDTTFEQGCNKSPKDREKSPISFNSQEKNSSKRSSSSSKNSKPPSILHEDQESKKSSKHSSTSSKSNKQEKKSPLITTLQRSQSQIQKDIKREPARKISTPTNLTAEAFYPLSTSREKNLVEPSPELKVKPRSNSFRLSFRRSKTPDNSSAPPPRPDRRKEKRLTPKPKVTTFERKLSFSDYLAVSREKSSETRPEVIVPGECRETLRISREKSPVLGFFRKTPSPRNLGRDRTPHLNRESGLSSNQYSLYDSKVEDYSRPSSSTGHKHASERKNDTGKSKGVLRRKERV